MAKIYIQKLTVMFDFDSTEHMPSGEPEQINLTTSSFDLKGGVISNSDKVESTIMTRTIMRKFIFELGLPDFSVSRTHRTKNRFLDAFAN